MILTIIPTHTNLIPTFFLMVGMLKSPINKGLRDSYQPYQPILMFLACSVFLGCFYAMGVKKPPEGFKRFSWPYGVTARWCRVVAYLPTHKIALAHICVASSLFRYWGAVTNLCHAIRYILWRYQRFCRFLVQKR